MRAWREKCGCWLDSGLFFFFFQAEDGIRDADVTGVQTCALPIFGGTSGKGSSDGATGDSQELQKTSVHRIEFCNVPGQCFIQTYSARASFGVDRKSVV